MPINYDKFDKIASDYERDDEEEIKAKKDAAPERKMKLMAQHDAMFMMIGWLAKAVPSLDNVETTRLVKYIATCDKVVTENRKTRLNGVADFVRTDCADKKPNQKALVSLCYFAEKMLNEAGGANERLAATRVLLIVMGALNTMIASDDHGGADKLEVALEEDAELAKEFEEYAWATAEIREHHTEREKMAKKVMGAHKNGKKSGVEEVSTDGTLVEGAADGEAEGAAMTDEQEEKTEDEMKMVREALAELEKGKAKLLRYSKQREGGPWKNVLKSTLTHLAIVSTVYGLRVAYEWYYEKTFDYRDVMGPFFGPAAEEL